MLGVRLCPNLPIRTTVQVLDSNLFCVLLALNCWFLSTNHVLIGIFHLGVAVLFFTKSFSAWICTEPMNTHAL